MKTLLKIISCAVLFGLMRSATFAEEGKPVTVMGQVTYTSLGISKEGTLSSIYGSSVESKFINSGVVSMVEDGEMAEELSQRREEFNNLNGGKGGYYEKTDAQGNTFWGYEKLDENKILKPEYRIDTSIDVTRARHGDDSSKQDINVTIQIYDVKTGELVSQSTEVHRNADPYANLQIIGPKPTWVEKYITGYVREIKYDDPVREAINAASKTAIDKLTEYTGQKAQSDADRFSGYMPLVPPEIANPPQEQSEEDIPEQGTPISKLDYNRVLNSPGCEDWAVGPETGVWCYDEGEMVIIGSQNLAGLFDRPPTFPFYDGNEPWQAPEPNTESQEYFESIPDDYSVPDSSMYTPSSGDSSPNVNWTVPR